MKIHHFYLNFGTGGEREYLIENLSMLLSSGLTIITALESIKKGIRSKTLRKIVEGMEEDIEGGSPLWKALENSKLFPRFAISLIQVGEKSGKLNQNLQVIALQLQKQKEFRSHLTSAMLYPVFVFALTAIIGIGIAWFILPNLARVFSELKIELPLITKVLIWVGNFLGEYGGIAIPLLIALISIFIYIIFIKDTTKFIGQIILFKIPAVKRLIQEVEVSRIGYILGTLLDSGLPIIESLRSLADATDFYQYRKFYLHLEKGIEEGNSFQTSFTNYSSLPSLIPPPVQSLIISAEKSGKLPNTLISIGSRFETKLDITTKNITVLLEPILLVIVWLGVVAVALAVILPLYSLIGNLNESK